MEDLRASLATILAAAVRGRGTASVSVLEPSAIEPYTLWAPESRDEPAFLAYSITKAFTASLVLKLSEEGQLRLDDPLNRWFPHIDRAERISLRQLLNHTAGIPDYGHLRSYQESVRASSSTPWSFERFADETYDKGLLFEPGQRFAYSNPGYMLLKRIVEEVSGQSYRDLIAERIARPLALKSTFVPESISDLHSLAPGVSRALSPDGSPREARRHYHPGWVSHGVCASTSSDLVRFLHALVHEHLVSRRSLDEMMQFVRVDVSPTPDPSPGRWPLRPRQPGYGLGLMGDPASPWGLLVGHNGGGPCYGASAFHAFDLGGLSVCAMGAIEEDFSAEQVVADVLDHLADVGNGRATQ